MKAHSTIQVIHINIDIHISFAQPADILSFTTMNILMQIKNLVTLYIM